LVLLWANRSLQKQNRSLDDQVSRLSAEKAPIVGSTISSLRGQTITNEKVVLDMSHRQRSSLLMVLSPVCPYCKVNFPNWKSLIPSLSSDQVVWVDITGKADEAYEKSASLPKPTELIRLDPEERTLYDLSVTPTTVVLDSHGTVKWAFAGVLDDKKLREIRELMTAPGA
jgi:hypothetical protein